MKQSKTKYLFLILFTASLNIFSQTEQLNIQEKYLDYFSAPREVVYLHLNKSVFVKNEMLAFNAYVIDKAKKKSLSITSNLYCTITNENNEIVRSKLIRVENSVSNNIFKLDSAFTTGKYSFRAYTNWMLNFNERNYYEHSFYVIDPDKNKTSKTVSRDKKYTIKALPEGGHFVSGIKNNAGIIVKDNNGFGLSNAKGKIISQENDIVTEFTLNQFGIAKAPFTPLPNKKYSVVVEKNEEKFSTSINNIENTGIIFSVSNLRGKVFLSFKTNDVSKEKIKKKEFFLAIHNGSDIKTTPIKFNDNTEIIKTINQSNLYSGINIFTVFDSDKNRPILERLYFNPNGVLKTKLKNINTEIEGDSLLVKLQLRETINPNKIQNISISVLPNNTKSYNFNSNILSKTYLEGYVRGFIEDASYYFSNTNPKTLQDLDHLLITQGWSSYDWGDIFNKPVYSNIFEQGINVVANIKGKVKEGFLVYPLKNNKTKIFTPSKTDKSFEHTNLFPEDDESYRVSLLKKSKNTAEPNLDIQFYPSQIPKFTLNSYDIPVKSPLLIEKINDSKFYFENDRDGIQLDEVIIESNTEKVRMEKIKNSSFGRVDFIDETESRAGITLAVYLSSKGFIAYENEGSLTIRNPSRVAVNEVPILVILDDAYLTDFSFLVGFPMDIVDYVEINKSGVGYGLRGGGGVIKIVTDPVKRFGNNSYYKIFSGIYEFPLSFNSPKQYYNPIYKDYTSRFFKEFGTLSWFPNLKVDENGLVTFKILNTNTTSINLYIEGVVNGETFISELKTINPFD